MSLENTHDIGNVKIVMLAGGGGGAVALSDLTDTNILNPSNGQVLGYNSTSGKWENMTSGGSGTSYAGLGIGKKTSVSANVIDTDIDLHRAPMVGDRLLIWFDATVQNPTGLTTYNNGTAVTSGLENVTPMYINAGWNILKYENSFLGTGWVRVQNVPIPNNTLSGLTDTAIVSLSDGQMLAYDNSSSKWKNKTIAPNNSGTPVRELKTLQIGDNVFDTFGLKTFDVTSVTSGVSGAISVGVITASQLNGEIIAVHTGSNSGTTTNAWTLALNDGQTIESLTMSKGGSAYTDAIVANCLLFVKCDISNSTATLLGIAGAGTTVQANPTGTSTVELNKLKIGNGVYDTSAIRPHTISSISSGSMTVHVTNLDQLNGKVIAICTESNTGTTSLAWELNLSDGGSSAGISMTNADGTDFTDEIVANELLFVYVDADNFVATVLGIVGAGSDDEIKTATGNPITITDAIAGNAIEVSAEIVASQDLHGYDHPWVGGAGKNILPVSLARLKVLNNSGGTWADNVFTVNDATITVNTDDGGNLISIVVNGTPSANITFQVANPTEFNAIGSGTFTMSGCPSGGATDGSTYFLGFYKPGASANDFGSGVSITLSGSETSSNMYIRVASGYQANNLTYRPMLRTSGNANFEPYSNICPITIFDRIIINRIDAESQTATVTVLLGQSVAGGTLDLTSGELTIDKGYAELVGADSEGWNWASSDATAWFYADLSGCIIASNKCITDKFDSVLPNPWNYDSNAWTRYGQIHVRPSTAVAPSGQTAAGLAEFKTWLTSNHLQVVYILATPTTTTLTAEQLALVKGYNQLSCNSGDMEITYKASGLDALKERVDELEDRVDDVETELASKTENSVVGTVESGTTASQAYAVGEHFIRNDKFCTCISAIASGATLTQGTNYVEGTIAECIARMGTYSTTETEIGTWNGQPLYRKIIEFGSLPNTTTKTVSSGLTNAVIHKIYGIGYLQSGATAPLPFIGGALSTMIVLSCDANMDIVITTGENRSSWTADIVLEYTKNS